MSVNEVKLKTANEAFVVRGTGPPASRTFCIGDEDHTIGNALRHIFIQNNSVGFAGYSVPHPSEPVVQIRLQTVSNRKGKDAPTALEVLKVGCQTLSDQCDVVLQKLEDLIPIVRDDRIRLEKIFLEESYLDAGGDDDDDDEEEVDDMDVDETETPIKPEMDYS
jgi:DNA-directed RNA polymerase I and III subunit RPAC2